MVLNALIFSHYPCKSFTKIQKTIDLDFNNSKSIVLAHSNISIIQFKEKILERTIDLKKIEHLRDIHDLLPVTRDYYEDWTIRIYDREQYACKNYLSPNRRDFYKILFISKGIGIFSIGINTYYIEKPTILFLHPNEIVSWKNLSDVSAGHFCLFKKRFIDTHPALKTIMEKHNLFSDINKSLIQLEKVHVDVLNTIFLQMHDYDQQRSNLSEDALQAYMQLIIVESVKAGNFPKPEVVSNDYKYIHDFFNLLEHETSSINYNTPIRMKTAKEFADSLSLHPNHLNVLLKKYTGQNVSTHIKNRLLEESKALLIQTNWTLQEIGYCIGFAEQPNFSQFFKKNIGKTPQEFRRDYKVN